MANLISKQTIHVNINDAPIIMGIINLTPDSFYDGGVFLNDEPILKQTIDEFNQLGVQMIDIGAESTRPGSQPLSADDEIARLSPYLSTIIEASNAIVCVDTYKHQTAQFALDCGVDYINDISGGENTQLLELVATYNAGLIIMHKKGSPQTMQTNPTYKNVTDEVYHYLQTQSALAKSYGIQSVIIDPGIGFGKTLDHNIQLLKNIHAFKSIECPILIGTSNKSFINEIFKSNVNERLPGSIASVLATYQKGAHIFRVHNAKETIQALNVFKEIQ